jgi:allantoinase
VKVPPCDLLIRGNIVAPSGVIANGWVAISGERIAAIGDGDEPLANPRHDFGSSYVLPGLIDGQTHAGSQFGFPGIEPTTRSAIVGGITTMVDMPYDEPRPVDHIDVLDAKAAAIAKHACCDAALYATIPSVPNVDDIHALVRGGAVAFKISSFENHPVRITNEHTLTLLEALAETDIPTGLHNERSGHREGGDRAVYGPGTHSAGRP